RAEAVLQLAEELLVVDDQLRLEILEQEPGLLEAVDRIDRRIASVAAARLDVEIHLADLQRPLDDGVEILLLDLPVGPKAEVVRQLANVLLAVPRVDDVGQQAVAEITRTVEVLCIDARDVLRVLFGRLVALEERIEDAVDVLGDRALLRTGRLRLLLEERLEPAQDLLGGGGDVLELTRRELAVVADRRVADELADLLRVLGRDLPDEVGEHLAGEIAHVLERRHRLLLGPVGEPAGPEVVVLVEALVLALREELAAPLQTILQRGERLLAVDLDALAFRLDLVLQVVQILLARRDVDRGDDRGCEVEHLLELARRDVEQIADAARHTLEEPDVRHRRRQVDVTHALAPDLLSRDLDAAALADDPLVADTLVLAAIAFPVLRGTEDPLAEETITLGLERPVVDRLRLRHLAGGPVANLLAGRKPDANGVEFIDVDQRASLLLPLKFSRVRPTERLAFFSLFLKFHFAFGQRRRFFFRVVVGDLNVAQIAERLVVRQGHLAVLVDPLLAFLGLFGCRRAGRRAQRAGREVDAELLRS